jgi:SAM-dependent methyltransferase
LAKDDFSNVYDDETRARAYAELELPGTYWLAYRDLPELLRHHAPGRRALDFGCGAGRSTRFLRDLGFETVGVDIARHMLDRARELDPEGDYRLVPDDGSLAGLEPASFDVVLSVFTFDNIPGRDRKVALFRSLSRVLADGGCLVSVVSSPEIYVHEWISFSTRDFPENRRARSGDVVRIVITDTKDPRPVEDVVWSDDAYRDVHASAGLEVVEERRPLGLPSEPYEWVSETEVAPWVVYVLRTARPRA